MQPTVAHLIEASKAGDDGTVAMLLEIGCDVNGIDGDGYTAVQWAQLWGRTACADVLRAAGAICRVPPGGILSARWDVILGGRAHFEYVLKRYRPKFFLAGWPKIFLGNFMDLF